MKNSFSFRFISMLSSLILLACFTFSCDNENQTITEESVIDCKGNYDHYKLSTLDAERYMSLYETYLDKIVIDNSAEGIPILHLPKFKGFKIPACEIETMVKEFGPGLEAWAFIGIKEGNPTLIFKVKKHDRDGNWTFFDFANPCPPACGFAPLKDPNCEGNYDHLKLSAQDAESYIAAYRNYLEKITINDSAEGTPILEFPKVRGFHIPTCEFETMVNELGTGFQVWANIGIKDSQASLIFQVSKPQTDIEDRNPNGEFMYFDFTLPCPTACP